MPGSTVVERTAARRPGLDLRRGVQRGLAEALVERAALLPAPDRYLIEGVFRDGRTIAELAALWGEDPEPGQTPRALRRRLHRLVARLRSPAFVLVAEQQERWEGPMARVGAACVLRGRSMREAAGELGMSIHTVRRHLDAIMALASAHGAGRELGRGVRQGVGR